jgi:hypothetical protein
MSHSDQHNQDDETRRRFVPTARDDLSSLAIWLGAFFSLSVAVITILSLVATDNEPYPQKVGETVIIGGGLLMLSLFSLIWGILTHLYSGVMETSDSLVYQNWRNRRLIIPWDDISRITIKTMRSGEGDMSFLFVHYVGMEQRSQRTTIFYGDSDDPRIAELKDMILRNTRLPRYREECRWWGTRLEIYEREI